MEREKEERMRREEARTEFSAEELALATIPGADFDPTRRQFSSDELRPQPIIRKRRKVLVTTLYWISSKVILKCVMISTSPTLYF